MIAKIIFTLFIAAALVVSLSAQAASVELSPQVDDCAGVFFGGDLKLRAVGQEVKCLQIVLNLDRDTQIAAAHDSAPGKETDYFGKLTKDAVISFQEKYSEDILRPNGLESGNGYVGKYTRAKLNEILTGILKKSFKVVETRSGRASYYSDFFQNRPTASGEIFDNYEYTAAHLDLPFNTKARITNPRNGRSVVIKINDRGPFIPGRIIDLSRIAARDLGLLQAGVGQVEIQILKPEID